jgi:hypothetical protein
LKLARFVEWLKLARFEECLLVGQRALGFLAEWFLRFLRFLRFLEVTIGVWFWRWRLLVFNSRGLV